MDIDGYNYYEEGYIYPNNNRNGKPNKQTLCYKQRQTEAQALELTHSHLGRLLQSAEMLAYKLNLISKGVSLIINFLDFYEKAIIIHNKKFKYELPESTSILINDLKAWERKASPKDKRFFTSILDLIQKGSYDDSVFPDENTLYEKAKKDNAKFKKSAGFWKTFSIPILNFLNNLIKSTQENLSKNPNYKPDIHFGSKATNNKNLTKTADYFKKEIAINTKLDEINNILLGLIEEKATSNMLINAINELNNLYRSFKNNYGDIELDKNKISELKKNIENLKSNDYNTYNLLKQLTIEIDENNYQ